MCHILVAQLFDLNSRIPYAGPVQILDGVEVDGVYRPVWKCQRTALKKKMDFRKIVSLLKRQNIKSRREIRICFKQIKKTSATAKILILL